ncbi:MAG: hypothetical protein JST93_20400 [Acidobacteria bacterium]|nr:hypothetical protein [Acidobacteriota bacterium]
MAARWLVCMLAAAALWADDPAVTLALVELQDALSSIGQKAETAPVDVRIVAGAGPDEGYEWRARGKRVEVAASSPLGAAYGIERLAWLTRSLRRFPPPDGKEAPALGHRVMFLHSLVPDSSTGPPDSTEQIETQVGRFREVLRDVLRFGYNGVTFRGLEHYVPSDDPVYGPRSERYRKYLKAIIAEAHAHHIRVIPYAEEAIYLPVWLEKNGAKASVKDPLFWQVLADKYRRLLRALPELDGVTPCVGEIIPSYDFRALDIVHSTESAPDPRMEDRYRAFFRAVRDVVVGEFGKLMMPWTWATNDWELSGVPDVYRRTFEPLPLEKLHPVIKLTKQDAWYYGTAFNPTFGQTKHGGVALAELASQYQGLGTVVDFPARWAGAALQFAAERGVVGVMTGQPQANLLQPGVLYVFSRMSWIPKGDADAMAEEWVAATFGPAAAKQIARILFWGSDAARHTFYWQPVALDGWPPQQHIRVNQIVLKGNAFWDSGREHDGYLRTLYLKLKPYAEETNDEAGQGKAIVEKMRALFDQVRAQVDPQPAAKLDELLRHYDATASLTRDYTRLILGYFQYREKRSDEAKGQLARDTAEMKASIAAYKSRFRFFELTGMEQAVILAERALSDLEAAERTLREAPTPQEIRQRILTARDEDRKALAAHPESVLVLRWKGSVDARNILRIQGDKIRMERLTGDGIHAVEAAFSLPVSREEGWRWAVKLLRERGIAHVMDTPSAKNDFTLSLYVDDPEPSSAVLEFEIYRWKDHPERVR